jgi:hypothetical protein
MSPAEWFALALAVVSAGALFWLVGIGLGVVLGRAAMRFELEPHPVDCGCRSCEAFRKAGL